MKGESKMDSVSELIRAKFRIPTLWAGTFQVMLTTLAIIMAVGSGHAITTYSGISVSGGGTIHGWGVTDATQGGMIHTAHVSTTLRSPQGRTASSGTFTGTNTVRADVYLPWSSTDLGTYTETSNHDYWCPAILATIFLAATQASNPIVAPWLFCGSVTRGITTNCLVTDLLGIWNTSQWKFIDGALVTQRTPASTAKTWSRTAVKSGMVSVKATGPDERTLTWFIFVSARNWHTNAANPVQVPNGTFYTLPVPPQPTGGDSGLGYFSETTGDPGLPNSTVIGAGPNQGYAYWANQLSISTIFQYEINPDLENSASVFSTKQYGACNFISWSNLLAQTRRHEYNSTTQSHHAFYKNSMNSAAKNPGDFVEQQVAAPGTNLVQFASDTRAGVNARYNQIGTDSEVEPFAVNQSETGASLGNINYAPYATCP